MRRRSDDTLAIRKLRFGEYLVQTGRLSRDQLFAALSLQASEENASRRLRVGDAVVQLAYLPQYLVERLERDFEHVKSIAEGRERPVEAPAELM